MIPTKNRKMLNAIILIAFLVVASVFGWRQNNEPQSSRAVGKQAPIESMASPDKHPASQPPAVHQDNPPVKPAPAPQARWHRSNLERHWEKHGTEFPEYHSAQEYGDGALRFFQNPPQGTLTKVRPNGEKLYYHPPSNTFGATAPDGTPKTLFRPSGRMNYWNRQ